jgi:hypothetical protein
MERYYVIRGQYRNYLRGDKLKAFVLAVFAWFVVSFSIYATFVGLFFVLAMGQRDWGAYAFIYIPAFLMGGFMTLGYGTFVLRGMFDWIDDWYIVKSNEPQILPSEQVKIKGAGHWWAIFKWGYDRSDRIRVFDGFEGRRYYYARNPRQGWRYDDVNPSWQYPQVQ